MACSNIVSFCLMYTQTTPALIGLSSSYAITDILIVFLLSLIDLAFVLISNRERSSIETPGSLPFFLVHSRESTWVLRGLYQCISLPYYKYFGAARTRVGR